METEAKPQPLPQDSPGLARSASETVQGLSNNSKGGLRGLIMGKVVTICSLAPPGPDDVGAGPQQEGVRTDRWQSGGLEAGELS